MVSHLILDNFGRYRRWSLRGCIWTCRLVCDSRGTRAKSIGLLHRGLNVLVVLMFAVGWWMRRKAAEIPTTAALVLSLIAVSMALVGGWLGGGEFGRSSGCRSRQWNAFECFQFLIWSAC